MRTEKVDPVEPGKGNSSGVIDSMVTVFFPDFVLVEVFFLVSIIFIAEIGTVNNLLNKKVVRKNFLREVYKDDDESIGDNIVFYSISIVFLTNIVCLFYHGEKEEKTILFDRHSLCSKGITNFLIIIQIIGIIRNVAILV